MTLLTPHQMAEYLRINPDAFDRALVVGDYRTMPHTFEKREDGRKKRLFDKDEVMAWIMREFN